MKGEVEMVQNPEELPDVIKKMMQKMQDKMDGKSEVKEINTNNFGGLDLG